MLLEFGLLVAASYLLGSIPLAYIIARWRYGVDIRKYGSGQVGASNLYRSVSKKAGLMVGLYDIGKGALLVWIAQLLGMGLWMEVAVGIAAVVGHNWPIFLRFNAGRGLATTAGVAFYLFPWGIWAFVGGAVFTLLLGASPLPVLVGLAAMPLASFLFHQPLELTLGLTALLLILVIRRLTAPRTARSSLVSTRELVINRFLFDRDIRDGKAWITFKPVPAGKSKTQREN
jgi:glycerol-3-phosphate acyltransferase PlsY